MGPFFFKSGGGESSSCVQSSCLPFVNLNLLDGLFVKSDNFGPEDGIHSCIHSANVTEHLPYAPTRPDTGVEDKLWFLQPFGGTPE